MYALEIPAIDNYAQRRLTVFDLERFTNDGSPSGHTFKHASSTPTTAWHGLPSYPLPVIKGVQRNEHGNSTCLELIHLQSKTEFPIHPDCIHLTGHQMLLNSDSWQHLKVSPTSSPRVVVVLPERRFAIKLHYPMKLGRFARPLLGEQLKLGVDVSQYFTKCKFIFNEFLPEIYAAEHSVNMLNDNSSEQYFGFLIRDLQPSSATNLQWAVPAFSILAKQNIGLLRRPLIEDIVEWVGVRTKLDFICDCLLPTLCESIAELVLNSGVWPEITTQNFFFGKTKNGVFKIIWRDFQGCFIDHEILSNSGYCGPLLKYSYHSIAPGQLMWRSYLLDDVFDHHIISPLFKIFKRPSDRNRIANTIRDSMKTKYLLELLPNEAFLMKKKLPRKNQRLELSPSPKPIWRS